MEPPATSVRSRKRAEVARRLTTAGLKLMATHSIGEAKVEQITAAAGVGKGTFFTHFKTKDAFVAHMVDQVLSDLARRVRPVALSPDDAEDLLASVGSVHLRFFQLRPEAAAVLTQACALSGKDGDAVRRRLDKHLDLVSSMIAPAAEAMGWPEEHNRELALIFLSTACGFYWFGHTLNLGHEMPVTLLERLGRMVARGLSADQGG